MLSPASRSSPPTRWFRSVIGSKCQNIGADGDVTAISLNVIKVQNADKTISTIPTHALLTESFRNWSGGLHEKTGVRRIKRSLFIDMHSIQVCTPEMVERFKHIELIRDYIDQKREELVEYNAGARDVEASPVEPSPAHQIGHLSCIFGSVSRSASRTDWRHDVPGASIAARRNWIADRDLRLLQGNKLEGVRSGASRYFRSHSGHTFQNLSCGRFKTSQRLARRRGR